MKIDFPKVPYPKNRDEFCGMSALGYKLRKLHLLEEKLNCDAITFCGNGNNCIESVKYETGKVYINKTQYFDNVSEDAWNMNIGGYNPLQKWMKDRKLTIMTEERTEHYRYMIIALEKTKAIMDEIDEYYEVI